MKPTLTVSSKGDWSFLTEAVGTLENAKVYVGIPEAETSRPGDVITNAGILYIQTNGSDVMNIPPRPVIEPAIEAPDNKKRLTDGLNLVANDVLNGDKGTAQTHLAMVGTMGANAAKRWFDDPRNNWAPNAPETIRRKGSDHPLIDLGELKRSITHVEEIL